MRLFMEIHGFWSEKRLEIKKTVDKSVETVENFMHGRGVEKLHGNPRVRKNPIFPQSPSVGQFVQRVAKYHGKCRKMEMQKIHI